MSQLNTAEKTPLFVGGLAFLSLQEESVIRV